MTSRGVARIAVCPLFIAVAIAQPGCGTALDTAPAVGNVGPSTVTVQVQHPTHKTLARTIALPGYTEAFAETPLYAKLAGYVEKLNVDIGDRVSGPRLDGDGKLLSPGQVLARLSVPELDDELAQKKALLVQADAHLEQAQAQIKVAEAAVATGRANVESAAAQEEQSIAEQERWKSEYGRVAELGRSSAVPQKLVDETKSQFRAAESARREAAAKVQAAKTALIENQALVDKARADEKAAQAARQAAEADLHRTEALEEYTFIRAPFDGVVSTRNIALGHFVQPIRTTKDLPLLVVIHADPLRIFVDVPEVDAGVVDVGDRVVMQIPAHDGRNIEAAITRTSWALDNATRALRAEIDIPNPDGQLRPGMKANVKIVLGDQHGVLAVPRAAVVTRDGQSYCFLVRDGKAVESSVNIGLESGTDVEIQSGVTPDDFVVVADVANLKNGQPVAMANDPVKP
ncbi:MAG TPA: efflux RND transporter periplasmic adaptor subunit [Pirellulales bacterium]|nr:efflux RND transporter periplasmic adaptor subunit [Pirellulales bacterium]